MKVKDILNSKGRNIFTVTEHDSVNTAVAALATNRVGFLIVMSMDGTVAGVISERDIVHRCMSLKKDPEQLKVGDIMTPKSALITAAEDDEIEKVMTTMTDKKVRHLPVFQDEEVVGLISIGDVIKFILEEKNDAIKSLMDYVSR
jgi:CBS domain-containing protein